MKVRISGNSIRFRLKQSEVQQFQQAREIKEIIAFGGEAPDKLSFVLKVGSAEEYVVNYQSNTVIVELPAIVCDVWTKSELVGFEKTINTRNGEAIKIVVEKDFECLDGSDEENEDAFPNPKTDC